MKTTMIFAAFTFVFALISCSKMEEDSIPTSSNQEEISDNLRVDEQAYGHHGFRFHGRSMGYATLVSWDGGPVVHKSFEGSGVLSHFGLCTFNLDYQYVTLNLNQTDPYNGIILGGATGSITVPNGDKFYCTIDLQGNTPYPYCGTYKFGGWTIYPPIPGLMLPTTNEILPSTCTITGGTGKFSNATGTMTVTGYQWDLPLTFPPTYQSYSIPTPTKFWVNGSINLHNNNHDIDKQENLSVKNQ